MIPNDFVQTLLARADIVDVIDRMVPLRKAGANYQACCPFHSEKTPSFTVSPTKQFYHCFGCGAHGTAIGFLMNYAGKSFPEAVESLARDTGLTVPRIERPGERERREQATDLGALLLAAAKFYRTHLKDAPAAIDYLKRRGLSGPIAARFGIGYAPDTRQALAAAFERYDDPALDAAGLVINGDDGRRYDRFRARIMFPIHDGRGRVIGFGGRVLGDGEPKYLNSPETALFSKGHELYGLFLARDAIRNAGRAVVVEGYMDVVGLAQHGVENSVATLGTATTPIHAQKLFRLTDSVVFCFDGDAAGRKAAWRALENTLAALTDGKEARFAFLPEGEDPDDFVRAHGKDAFERVLDDAVPLSEYLVTTLASRHRPATAEGRAALVAAARPLVANVAAPILATLLRRRLGELAGLPEDQLKELLAHEDERGPLRTPSSHRGALTTVVRRPPSLTRALIEGLLVAPDLARRHDLPQISVPGPEAEALRALIDHCRANEGDLTTAGVIQHFSGTSQGQVFATVLATALDQQISTAQAETQVLAAGALWRERERQNGLKALLAKSLGDLSPDERHSLATGLATRVKDGPSG